MDKRMIYASRLMKGHEALQACQEFREQEKQIQNRQAQLRRSRFRLAK